MHVRKRRVSKVSLEAALESVEECGPQKEYGSEDTVLTGSIDRINLERVIESLSPGYRITFVLHDVEGYEHNEIAEMLSCSIGTSKSQLHEARMILRDQLNITRSEYGRRRAPHTKTKVSAPAKRHPKAVATAA
jgi:RNA polymerase sigma-70 factor (ECF subfamily)